MQCKLGACGYLQKWEESATPPQYYRVMKLSFSVFLFTIFLNRSQTNIIFFPFFVVFLFFLSYSSLIEAIGIEVQKMLAMLAKFYAFGIYSGTPTEARVAFIMSAMFV